MKKICFLAHTHCRIANGLADSRAQSLKRLIEQRKHRKEQ